MSETTILVLLSVMLLVGVLGVAFYLDRQRKTHGNLFTGKPSRKARIIAIILGLLFGAITISEIFFSNTIHFLWPIFSVALLAYGFGLSSLLDKIQKG